MSASTNMTGRTVPKDEGSSAGRQRKPRPPANAAPAGGGESSSKKATTPQAPPRDNHAPSRDGEGSSEARNKRRKQSATRSQAASAGDADGESSKRNGNENGKGNFKPRNHHEPVGESAAAAPASERNRGRRGGRGRSSRATQHGAASSEAANTEVAVTVPAVAAADVPAAASAVAAEGEREAKDKRNKSKSSRRGKGLDNGKGLATSSADTAVEEPAPISAAAPEPEPQPAAPVAPEVPKIELPCMDGLDKNQRRHLRRKLGIVMAPSARSEATAEVVPPVAAKPPAPVSALSEEARKERKRLKKDRIARERLEKAAAAGLAPPPKLADSKPPVDLPPAPPVVPKAAVDAAAQKPPSADVALVRAMSASASASVSASASAHGASDISVDINPKVPDNDEDNYTVVVPPPPVMPQEARCLLLSTTSVGRERIVVPRRCVDRHSDRAVHGSFSVPLDGPNAANGALKCDDIATGILDASDAANSDSAEKVAVMWAHATDRMISVNNDLHNELQDTKRALATAIQRAIDAEKRLNELIARAGESHIQRDAHMAFENGFPNGEDMVSQFSKATISLEMLLEDAAEFMADVVDKGAPAAAVHAALIHDVLRPLFEGCFAWVARHINVKLDAMESALGASLTRMGSGVAEPPNERQSAPSLCWLSTQQVRMPRTVEELTDADVLQMLAEFSPLGGKLHDVLRALCDSGEIAYGDKEQELTVLSLLRILLRFMVFAELSDPRCEVGPAPGSTEAYHPKHHKEVISGTRTHGRIQDGDEVHVLFPGLTFLKVNASWDNAGSSAVVCKALVMRQAKK